ncbi:MAG: ATP-dependent Clp protease ATP-binding subunit [Acidobacteriaceae bacterium]|nr:ATP-dependent Clp protease ATP-binding subunit [Acidobacteriaceae bacterium]MBV8572066.1 ATP-dependent Clp protease ATP-binding subunit [Acidobacteriaceae bacterium]
MRRPIVLDPNRSGKQAETLQNKLRGLIIGQDEAITHIVDLYQTYLAGLTAHGRPIGNLLFLGPTGSGKTRTVEATAEVLTGTPGAVIKIDCAEFQHSHEIAKLIGSPPGYLGHRETHPALSQEVIDRHHTESVQISFILFDEIEKASDSLWNLLLGILDKATLTLGDNRRVDFSRAMIFMTSNLGAGEMSDLMAPKLGFQARRMEGAAALDEKLTSKMTEVSMQAARRKFTPEFINRIDKIAVFRPLGQADLQNILTLELRQVQQRILNTPADKPFVFRATDKARTFLLSQGSDMKYGARHLKRTIERLVVCPLSNLIATEQVSAGDWIEVDFDPETQSLSFERVREGLGFETMAGLVESAALSHATAHAA